MKKETTSSAKATPKPKAGEKKATVKKTVKSSDVCAATTTEMTCQLTEQVTNHIPDQLTNQSATSDCLIATRPTTQIINGFPVSEVIRKPKT